MMTRFRWRAAALAALLLSLFAPIVAGDVAHGQTPGAYRVGQTVNTHQLIVCADKLDAEDIADGFKVSDDEAADEFALSEELKEKDESLCRRLDGEKVRIAAMPVFTGERKADGEKVAIVPVETVAGARAYFAVLFGGYSFEPAAVVAPPPPPAVKSPVDTIPGRYSVSGVNPNGSSYSGEVTIRLDRDTYHFLWRVGRDTFRGSGKLRGRTLTINWGQSSPVIYQVGNDGTLRGRWSNGRGTEDLKKIE